MEDLELVRVKALVAFTEPTPRGMFHGDPNNSEKGVKFPYVPEAMVARLVEEGKATTAFDPLDHDRDGEKGGSRKGAASTAAKGAAKKGGSRKGAASTAAKGAAKKGGSPEGGCLDPSIGLRAGAFKIDPAPGIGMYEITGPGLEAPEKVKGKAKAQERLDELNAALPADGADDIDAPVD